MKGPCAATARNNALKPRLLFSGEVRTDTMGLGMKAFLVVMLAIFYAHRGSVDASEEEEPEVAQAVVVQGDCSASDEEGHTSCGCADQGVLDRAQR